MGFHILHEPIGTRNVDIIFVHGLGGSSRLTWAWERDLSLFWPKEWLPLEPGLSDARIFSFGYDANFTKSTQDTLNIKAFAEQLLNAMKFGRGEYEDWDIGKARKSCSS
ncbi:hypothetical protein BN1723_004263, partial [Verticillium longisporum]